MSAFEDLLCVLTHAPLDVPLVRVLADESVSYRRSSLIPLWDEGLHDSSMSAYIPASGDRGRARGRAWGISNPFQNLFTSISADFVFEFVLDPSRVAFPGGPYEFRATIVSEGRFLHFAAAPQGANDPRRPRASTTSLLNSRVSTHQIRPDGSTVMVENTGVRTDSRREVVAVEALTEVVNRSQPVTQVFEPSGTNPTLFRVHQSVSALAGGVYSDIRIRGNEGRHHFRVRVVNARVQKLLTREDPCIDVLRG